MIQDANLTWRSIDTRSNIIFPWFTRPCLEWLEKQDIGNWDIFEYGCGYSTIWFRLNAKSINAVDDNERWAKAMGADYMETKERYVMAIVCPIPEKFDCIVVDGAWRIDCVEYCRDFLKPGGFLIIDNWTQDDFHQEYCDRADELLVGWGKKLYKEPIHSQWTTAVFQKPA